jgi:probable F420-dependent oxidoreductase
MEKIMRIGLIYPHFEFGSDPTAIRTYAQAAEGLGFSHIGADDHIIGPNPNRPGGWTGWVTYQTTIMEPFVLFGFLAAATQRIEFSTCVLLLPQRQTVLVAKQTATLDRLCGGRLRLGIGIGWNEIEYISLGKAFHNRGSRIEEQIQLLRQLWTQPHVDFHSPEHTIPDAGINPLPLQLPIPIWFGGQSDPALKRMARLGDGWMPLYRSPEEAKPALDTLTGLLQSAGRSLNGFGIEARIPYSRGVGHSPDPAEWQRLLAGWQALGATHASLVTTNCGLQGAEAHLRAIQFFAKEVGLAAG